jgi:hypothetical protein
MSGLIYFSGILPLKISPTRLPAIIAATFTKVPNKGISFLLLVLLFIFLAIVYTVALFIKEFQNLSKDCFY